MEMATPVSPVTPFNVKVAAFGGFGTGEAAFGGRIAQNVAPVGTVMVFAPDVRAETVVASTPAVITRELVKLRLPEGPPVRVAEVVIVPVIAT